MTAEVVPAGPYFGFTLSELDDELTRYKAARQQAGSRLQSASVNGQSYVFATASGSTLGRSDWSLDQWQTELMIAFGYLAPGKFVIQPATNSAVGAFL